MNGINDYRNRSFQSDSTILVVAKVTQNEYTVLIGQFPLLDEISSVNGCGALNRITLTFESLWRLNPIGVAGS